MRWTVLNLDQVPDQERCCVLCNPDHEDIVEPCDPRDPRLVKYAEDFYYPHVNPDSDSSPERPLSAASMSSQLTVASSQASTRTDGTLEVTKESTVELETLLVKWRDDQSSRNWFTTARGSLPPQQLQTLVKAAKSIAATDTITAGTIRKIARLQHLEDTTVEDLCSVLTLWRRSLSPRPLPESRPTPRSQRRESKRVRTSISAIRDVSPTPKPSRHRSSLVLPLPTPPLSSLRPQKHSVTTHSQPTQSQTTPLSRPPTFYNLPHPPPPATPSEMSPSHYRQTHYENTPTQSRYYRAQTAMYAKTPIPPQFLKPSSMPAGPSTPTPSQPRSSYYRK